MWDVHLCDRVELVVHEYWSDWMSVKARANLLHRDPTRNPSFVTPHRGKWVYLKNWSRVIHEQFEVILPHSFHDIAKILHASHS